MALIAQEVATEREIEIPEPVRDVYRQWRPTPLYRARRLERALDTPARIYYKYEGVSPAGSHKPNTAVAQAFYNKEAGVKRHHDRDRRRAVGFVAGLRGRAVRPRGATSTWCGSSYDQKPYRRALMETYGARCVASPSSETNAGRADPGRNVRISRAASASRSPRRWRSRRSATTPNTRSASVLNHVLLHQTVIGQEAMAQLEMAGDYPGRHRRLHRRRLEFRRHRVPVPRRAAARRPKAARHRRRARACPSLTRGKYAYDFGDTGHLTPLVKMHTLGSTFMPPGFHAGGLRYHGMAPLVSHPARSWG